MILTQVDKGKTGRKVFNHEFIVYGSKGELQVGLNAINYAFFFWGGPKY